MTTVVWVVVATTGLGLRHILYRQQKGHTQQQMMMLTMKMKEEIIPMIPTVFTGSPFKISGKRQLSCSSSLRRFERSEQQYRDVHVPQQKSLK